MTSVHFAVRGMSCSGCAQSIIRRLSAEAGVESVVADHVTGEVDVAFDEAHVTATRLNELIENLGYEAEIQGSEVKG